MASGTSLLKSWTLMWTTRVDSCSRREFKSITEMCEYSATKARINFDLYSACGRRLSRNLMRTSGNSSCMHQKSSSSTSVSRGRWKIWSLMEQKHSGISIRVSELDAFRKVECVEEVKRSDDSNEWISDEVIVLLDNLDSSVSKVIWRV